MIYGVYVVAAFDCIIPVCSLVPVAKLRFGVILLAVDRWHHRARTRWKCVRREIGAYDITHCFAINSSIVETVWHFCSWLTHQVVGCGSSVGGALN